MEKKILQKEEVLNVTTLQNDVKVLKEALEIKGLKERMIVAILQEQNIALLDKAEKALQNALFPKRPGDRETALSGQGNR